MAATAWRSSIRPGAIDSGATNEVESLQQRAVRLGVPDVLRCSCALRSAVLFLLLWLLVLVLLVLVTARRVRSRSRLWPGRRPSRHRLGRGSRSVGDSGDAVWLRRWQVL